MANPRSMTRRLVTLIWVVGLGTIYSLYLRDWLSSDGSYDPLALQAPELDLWIKTLVHEPIDGFINKALG